MLKKAGIVVAAAAAALLAVSPLAFAGNDGDLVHGSDEGGSHGLINVAGNDVNVPIQVCNTDVPILAVDVEDIAGAVGIAGEAEADSGDGEQRTCEADSEGATHQDD